MMTEPDGALRALRLRVVRLRGEIDLRRLRVGPGRNRERGRQDEGESAQMLHRESEASEPRPL